jgi:acyl carrier protein
MELEVLIDEVRQFVVAEFLNGKGEGLDADTPLIDWGVIDSVAIVSLREFVHNRYGVLIPNTEMRPANLTSLRTIAELIKRVSPAP